MYNRIIEYLTLFRNHIFHFIIFLCICGSDVEQKLAVSSVSSEQHNRQILYLVLKRRKISQTGDSSFSSSIFFVLGDHQLFE